jgi:hypothetical protein
MGLFKKMFGGKPDEQVDDGLYFYIKLERQGEIVRIRLNRASDLNRDYETGEYSCRKHIIGPKTYQKAEAYFAFDGNYRLLEWDIQGGELVREEDWEAQQMEEASSE